MSLKNVHLAFVTAAVALSLFCAVQAFASYREHGATLSAAAAVTALLAGAFLVRYGAMFLKRCREEGIR